MSRALTTCRWDRGFSLIELLVTIAVATILLLVVVPAFNDALLGSRLAAHANDFVASVHLARSEAIKRNAAVTLCASSNGTSCAASGSWEQGWIILVGGTVVHYRASLSSGLKMSAADSGRSLTFQPTGLGATSTTLTLCRNSPSAGSQERVITVSVTGRAAITKTTTGVCS